MANQSSTESSARDDWHDLPLIDKNRLDELRNIAGPDGDAFLIELRDAFDQDAAVRVAAVGEAIKKNDAIALRNVAHTLKGSCTNVGATAMAKICLTLEIKGRDAKMQGTAELALSLEEAFELTTQAFNEVVAEK